MVNIVPRFVQGHTHSLGHEHPTVPPGPHGARRRAARRHATPSKWPRPPRPYRIAPGGRAALRERDRPPPPGGSLGVGA